MSAYAWTLFYMFYPVWKGEGGISIHENLDVRVLIKHVSGHQNVNIM